jgi:hypothetical protein
MGRSEQSERSADNADKIRQEKTVELSAIADIRTPRKSAGKRGLIVKTKDFTYPLIITHLSEDVATDIRLQKGDILLSQAFHGKHKFYLICIDPPQPCYPSSFLTVIRPRANNLTPEYLFFYLQSETINKYFLHHRSGTHFPRLTIQNLPRMEVVLPELETQTKSKSIFAARFLARREEVIQKLNTVLYQKGLPRKPIQREFIEELLVDIAVVKQQVLDKLILHDLNELEGCSRHDYLKSLLILAGSVLEAFLLDWLCEIERKDYFMGEEEFTLGKLIWKKLKGHLPQDSLSEQILRKSDQVKKGRDMVHAKVYFNGPSITHELCDDVLSGLRFVIQSRSKRKKLDSSI